MTRKLFFTLLLLAVLVVVLAVYAWEGSLTESCRIRSPDGRYIVVGYRKNNVLDLFFGHIGDASGGEGVAKVVNKNGDILGTVEVRVFYMIESPYWDKDYVKIGSKVIPLH